MKLIYELLHQHARPPEFKTPGAACFDIAATGSEYLHDRARLYYTGISFDIPEGYYIELNSRSGHGFNDDLRLANCTGIIDSDYTGEVKVKLTHDGQWGSAPEWPYPGDRVAQGRLVRCVKTELVDGKLTKQTERGSGGFGSTGK